TLLGSRNESSMIVIDLERSIRSPLGDPRTTMNYTQDWASSDQGVLGLEIQGRRMNIRNFPLSGGSGRIILEGAAGVEFESGTVSPDGKTMLFSQCLLIDKIFDIMELPLGQEPVVKPFIQTPDSEVLPRFSPSGNLVAYVSQRPEDPSGPVLKVTQYPGQMSSIQVSASATASSGLWIKPDEVAWVDGSRMIWSATVTVKDGELEVSIPKPLSHGQPLDQKVRVLDYDVQSDRFLVAVEDSARDDLQLVIVSDWRPQKIVIPSPAR
ncbi:MAG: PD40 domain-containing protein, partial [Planctomycetes bacterium]|nr:PD40 domain-containing protein [Planctomycetota bacterium]